MYKKVEDRGRYEGRMKQGVGARLQGAKLRKRGLDPGDFIIFTIFTKDAEVRACRAKRYHGQR